MAGAFLLLSIHFYRKSLTRNSTGIYIIHLVMDIQKICKNCFDAFNDDRYCAHNFPSKVWFVGSLLLVMCSALSKEIGVTTIALCLAYDLLIHKKVQHSNSCSKHFLLTVGPLAVGK